MHGTCFPTFQHKARNVGMVECAPEAVEEGTMSGASTNDRSKVVHHIMPNAYICLSCVTVNTGPCKIQ